MNIWHVLRCSNVEFDTFQAICFYLAMITLTKEAAYKIDSMSPNQIRIRY